MILIIDDHMPVAGIMARYLERAGHLVAIAYNRQDALAQIPMLPNLQLVILDIYVPTAQDGMSLLATLQRERPTLPVLLMTGAVVALPLALMIRPVPILRKPIPMYQLVEAVQAQLARAASEVADADPTH